MATLVPLRIYIGFDSRQIAAYTALHTSLMLYATGPLAITPLVFETLPIKRKGLTPFTYSRFLVPYLCGYEGQALFMDADMLAKGDIFDIFKRATVTHDVMVVKSQLEYERSSLMLFNCAHCSILTLQYVNDPANALIDLSWAKDVGALPAEWNHLVGYDAPNPKAKVVHFTQGVPAFIETVNSEHADSWKYMLAMATHTQPWADVMGNSVHAKPVRDRLRAEMVKDGKL